MRYSDLRIRRIIHDSTNNFVGKPWISALEHFIAIIIGELAPYLNWFTLGIFALVLLFRRANRYSKFGLLLIGMLAVAINIVPKREVASFIARSDTRGKKRIIDIDGTVLRENKRVPNGGREVIVLDNFKILLIESGLPWEDFSKGDNFRGRVECRSFLTKDLMLLGFVAKCVVKSSRKSIKHNLALVENLAENILEKEAFGQGLDTVIAANLGVNSLIDKPTKELFKIIGLTHILVISGGHLYLISMLLERLVIILLTPLAVFLKFFNARRVARIFSLIIIIVFSCSIGVEGSIARSLITLLVVFLINFSGLNINLLEAIFKSLIPFLIYSPETAYDLGFYLSLLGFIGLIYGGSFVIKNRFLKYLTLNFFPWLFTAPLIAVVTGRFSPMTLIYSLTFLPLINCLFIQLGGVAIILFIICPAAGVYLLELTDFICTRFLEIMVWLFL